MEQLSVQDYITRIQEILLNNSRILEGLCSEKKAGWIRMRDLIGKGFNTKFMISVAEPTESGGCMISVLTMPIVRKMGSLL